MNFSNCYKESNEIHGMIWLKIDHFAVNNNNLSLNLTKWFPLWILWHGSHGESYHIFTIKQFHHVGAGGVMGALQGRQVPPTLKNDLFFLLSVLKACPPFFWSTTKYCPHPTFRYTPMPLSHDSHKKSLRK